MRVRVYTICWNERRVIDCFLRHYEAIAEHIVFYDKNIPTAPGRPAAAVIAERDRLSRSGSSA